MTPLAIAALVFAADPAPLNVGFAEIDITPPVGYRMAGNYTEVFNDGVLDPLFAKAVYFEQTGQKGCIVVCDVCGQNRELTNPARNAASKLTGIPVRNIAVTATHSHTHCGPMHYDPVFLELNREKADGKPGLDDYQMAFIAKCVAAVVAAQKAARPAELSVARAKVPGVAFNRRFHMKDGSVRFNPGKLNPGIVAAAGPTDDTLPLIFAAAKAGGKPFGAMYTFDMHTAVTGGRKYSACYPGHVQLGLRKAFGPDFVSVFGEGCAGDVNHVDVSKKAPDRTAAEIGAVLAAAAGAELPRAKAIAANFAVASGVVNVPLRDDRPLDVDASKQILLGKKPAEFLEQVEAYRVLYVRYFRKMHDDAVPLEVQVFRLGADAAVVTLPHEIFVELGAEIRRQSPFRETLILSLANDVDCYVPTRKAFGEGSYEVTNSPYKAGCGELLVNEAVRLLKRLAK